MTLIPYAGKSASKKKPRSRRNVPGRKLARRPRGAASVPCPECQKKTRVLRTTRDEEDVVRERMCVDDHRFTTREKADV